MLLKFEEHLATHVFGDMQNSDPQGKVGTMFSMVEKRRGFNKVNYWGTWVA